VAGFLLQVGDPCGQGRRAGRSDGQPGDPWDNLHAFKSLLPRYAGQVDLIFIDPPDNTGNENWVYSDGVNSPIMKEWLSSNRSMPKTCCAMTSGSA
jgi:hypothetical protein